MRKIILLSIICAALAYCADRYINSQKQENILNNAQAAQLEQNKAIISDLVTLYSANYKWYKEFDRKKDVPRPRLVQAELEDQWIGYKPIIFIGNIDDYRNKDDGNYQVTIKPNSFSFGMRLYGVGLDVAAPKELIKNFLSTHPEAMQRRFSSQNGSVVVVAKLSSVEKRFEGSGDDAGEVRYGVGELLDIRFLKGRLRYGKDKNIFDEADGS